jgi:hypothetical protein
MQLSAEELVRPSAVYRSIPPPLGSPLKSGVA